MVAEILREIIRTSLFTLDKSTEKAWARHMQGWAWKRECVLALKFWEEWGSNWASLLCIVYQEILRS